jgi:chromosome segregation ATPase
VSTAKSLFIRCESGIWSSLRSQRAALAKANERLAQQSTELADLRLLCDDLKSEVVAAWAEAALAWTEAQQRQLELSQVIGERNRSRSQAAEAAGRAEALEGQLAEVSARAGALAEDLAVAVGSAQVMASQERARAEGMFHLLCDFNSASFFDSCLKNFDRLSAELETALNESIKAHAPAADQNETDRVAMSEAISAFCRAFDLDFVPSGSSP